METNHRHHRLSKAQKNDKGSALMLAITTVAFVMFLATEITNQSIVEYLASTTEVRKVKAHYAAKACMQLSLLRIKAYQQATNSLAGKLPQGMDTKFLDLIWSFPLIWPPRIPGEISNFDKSTMNKTVAASLLKDQFHSSISAEGGRIDINDLGSPSKTLREKTRRQLLDRIKNRVVNSDDAFSNRYADYNFEELLNNIGDYVDADRSSPNGGSERGYYSEIDNEFIPPNRPFKTIEELHMVAGMTDEIYAWLAPQVTLYGVKGINVNQAERDVLLTLFNETTPEEAEEIVKDIIERREDPLLGGPFRDNKDFLNFLSGYNLELEKFNEERVPLYYGANLNFNINCVGVAGNMTKEIEAIVYNPFNVSDRLKTALENDIVAEDGSSPLRDCKDQEGDNRVNCLCAKKPAKEKDTCIQRMKKALQDLNKKPQGPPRGPPSIIHYHVK